jgi:thioredoxin 1
MNTNLSAEKTCIDVNENTFANEVLTSPQPVLVDFWAGWCGPCRMIGPVVESLANDFAGRARVAKVNVDENPELCGRYGISSIPALLFFKDGKVVDRVVGAVSKTLLADKLSKCL